MDIKAISFTVISLILLTLLKERNKDLGRILSIISSCILLLTFVLLLKDVMESIYAALRISYFDIQYLELIMKALGISVLSQAVSDFCSDAGEKALSRNIILVGKASVILVIIPVLKSTAELLRDVLIY